MILAIVFFLVGSFLHTLAQVDAIVRSKSNPANSRIELLKDSWIPLFNRTCISLAFFVLWLEGELVTILTSMNIPIADPIRAVLDLHIGGAVAFLVGISFDAAVAFIPALKAIVPANPLTNGATAKPDAPKVP